tara:strand:+ start:2123 stop:2437 length:315 start_codon:yes stop_codon:yes gene_type:complete
MKGRELLDRFLEHFGKKELGRQERIVGTNGQSGWDIVDRPEHYANQGPIECIDAIESMLSREEFIGYLRGNVFKYQWRRSKGNFEQDLEKSRWYSNRLWEYLRK